MGRYETPFYASAAVRLGENWGAAVKLSALGLLVSLHAASPWFVSSQRAKAVRSVHFVGSPQVQISHSWIRTSAFRSHGSLGGCTVVKPYFFQHTAPIG